MYKVILNSGDIINITVDDYTKLKINEYVYRVENISGIQSSISIYLKDVNKIYHVKEILVWQKKLQEDITKTNSDIT